MKPLERPMADKKVLFTLGSALDNDDGWKFEEEKSSSKPVEIKTPSKHLLVLKMEKRQGKPVSIVGPFFLEKEALITLCSLVKKSLAVAAHVKLNGWSFKESAVKNSKRF